jgi:hypothetical protein
MTNRQVHQQPVMTAKEREGKDAARSYALQWSCCSWRLVALTVRSVAKTKFGEWGHPAHTEFDRKTDLCFVFGSSYNPQEK